MMIRSFVVLLGGLLLGVWTPNPLHVQSDDKDRRPPNPSSRAICGPLEHMSSAQFELLLQTIRTAWLEGNQAQATACFSANAIYSIPPSHGLVGRESLSQVFMPGPHKELPTRIEWHHMIYDPALQIGAVEYTVQRRIPTHGVIIIKISNGLICNWRQYAVASDMTWEKFRGMNDF
jgi:hypothetical protein